MNDETTEGHLQELRRGTIVLACLIRLKQPGYGYSLLESLEGYGFKVDAKTLYPLLRRLEQQGYLTSEWNTEESRPRKFYRTSDAGERLATTLLTDWHSLGESLTRIQDES